ncbi:NADase-type glycan-binding domain-containing protein [Geomonas edaphica]|uniref:NADase-type glycan-binding domain-containing protein n=1 Tax=Geomonas edaphica TaxID=2570226 RepID=UPI0010A7F0C0|nr:hypothetical protein [Geomonas edaphica]
MKTSIVLATAILTLLSVSSYAIEFKTVKAVQGRDSDYFDYEDAVIGKDGKEISKGKKEFLPGCSWYCGGYVKKISASAEMPPEGKTTYKANNAHDFDKDTAWIPRKNDFGVGESLTYQFNFDKEKNYKGTLGVTTILMANGYKKSRAVWEANSRVKKMRMYVNGMPYRDIKLLDSYEVQTVDIGEIMFPPRKTTILKFEILEVYPGKKYRETAISELVFEGVGVH